MLLSLYIITCFFGMLALMTIINAKIEAKEEQRNRKRCR